MPERSELPVMLYDGDCAFCRGWIERWRGITGNRVDYAPYQEDGWRHPQVTAMQCENAVQLILPDGSVLSGAHAVLKALSLSGEYTRLLWSYETIPLFGRAAERFYQLVAHHRVFFSGSQR